MFELDWPPDVLDRLADIWVAASPDDRGQIGAGIERLDRDLARDPFEVGESRDGPYRVTFVAGLTVQFAVVAYIVRVSTSAGPADRGMRRPGHPRQGGASEPDARARASVAGRRTRPRSRVGLG